MERTFLSAQPGGHAANLQEALTTLATKGTTVTVTTREGATLCLNLDLLLLYSPLLRSLHSSLPFASSPRLLLPSASLPSLLALQSLLTSGRAGMEVVGEEVEEVAQLLGLPLNQLVKKGGGKDSSGGEPEKTKPVTENNTKAKSSEASKLVKITDCIKPSKPKEVGKAENQVKEKEVSQDIEKTARESAATNKDTSAVNKDSNEESSSEISDTPPAPAGGVVSVEVYGEEEETVTAVKTEPIETEPMETEPIETEFEREDAADSTQKETTVVNKLVAEKRKANTDNEELIKKKKKKVLETALQNLVTAKSPEKAAVEAVPAEAAVEGGEAATVPAFPSAKAAKKVTDKKAAAAMLRVMNAGQTKAKEAKEAKEMKDAKKMKEAKEDQGHPGNLGSLGVGDSTVESLALLPGLTITSTMPAPAPKAAAAPREAPAPPKKAPAPEPPAPAPMASPHPTPKGPTTAPGPPSKTNTFPQVAPTPVLPTAKAAPSPKTKPAPKPPATPKATAAPKLPPAVAPSAGTPKRAAPAPKAVVASPKDSASPSLAPKTPKATPPKAPPKLAAEAATPKTPRRAQKAALNPGSRQLLSRDGSCNYGLTCEVCQVESKTLTALYTHVISHIKTDLEKAVKELKDGSRCKVCGQIFARASALVNHLGMKHGKVNDVLKEKGYRVLPCLIATEGTKGAEVQANLMVIRRRRWRLWRRSR